MNETLRRLAMIAAIGLAAPATAQAPAPDEPKSDMDKIGDTVENIGARPLKDLNIIKPKVAPEIERVMAAPYSLTGLRTCPQFKTAIDTLTGVLGPDVDSPLNQKKEKTPAEQALSLSESAAGGIIPFSGVVRRLSGAEAKQKYAAAAVYAGSVRRAYLKGTARAKGCKV